MPVTDKGKALIKFYTEIIKLLVFSLIATLGGIVTLIVGGNLNGPKNVFIGAGLLLAVGMIIVIYQLITTNQRLINELH